MFAVCLTSSSCCSNWPQSRSEHWRLLAPQVVFGLSVEFELTQIIVVIGGRTNSKIGKESLNCPDEAVSAHCVVPGDGPRSAGRSYS